MQGHHVHSGLLLITQSQTQLCGYEVIMSNDDETYDAEVINFLVVIR